MNAGTARSVKKHLGDAAYLHYKKTGEYDEDRLEFERAISDYSKPSREIYTKIHNEGSIQLSWLRDRFASATAEDVYVITGTMELNEESLFPTRKFYERLGLKYPAQAQIR